MTVKKVDLEEASKSFQHAQSIVSRIPVNHKDSIYNVGAATNNYVVSLGTAQMKIAEGLNDILERLERIENMLKATGQRRP